MSDMRRQMSVSYWLLVAACIAGVIVKEGEDALWWVGLCCILFSVWFVIGCVAAWLRCCEEDCDDDYEGPES